MHKQFQRFGFFVTKNANEEAASKAVKCLYKKEIEKSPKRKIKSIEDAENANHLRRRKEDKHRSHRNKSRESLARRPRRRESKSNSSTVDAELFYISPEDLKRHRKRIHGTREKSAERITESRKKQTIDKQEIKRAKEEEIAKLIKRPRQKVNAEHDHSEWLTKRDILKLINTVKDTPKSSGSTSFFRKFFLFDREETSNTPAKQNDNYERKKYRIHSEDYNNAIALPRQESRDTTSRKLEKIKRNYEDSYESNRHRDKTKTKDEIYRYHQEEIKSTVKSSSKSKDKYHDHKNHSDSFSNPSPKNTKKGNPKHKESALIFEELEIENKNDETEESFSKQKSYGRHSEKTENSKSEIESRNEIYRNKEQVEIATDTIEELKKRLTHVNHTNPLRHKYCLVKNTFSLVDIPPTDPLFENFWEKKKKLKAFKKYYKYAQDDDKSSLVTTSTDYHTFSDSYKMYQDSSQQSFEFTAKKPSKKMKIEGKKRPNLTVDTNISTIHISPTVSKIHTQTNKEKKVDSKKKKLPKSKIPIPNSAPKLIELPNESFPTPKSRQKSADLFVPKELKGDFEENLEEKNEKRSVKNVKVSKEEIPRSRIYNDKFKSGKMRNRSPSRTPRSTTLETLEEENVNKTKQNKTGSPKFREKSSLQHSSRNSSVERRNQTKQGDLFQEKNVARNNSSNQSSTRKSNLERSIEKSKNIKPLNQGCDTIDKKTDRIRSKENSPSSRNPSLEKRYETIRSNLTEFNCQPQVKNKSPSDFPRKNTKSPRTNEQQQATVWQCKQDAEIAKSHISRLTTRKGQFQTSRFSSLSKQSEESGDDKAILSRRNHSRSPPSTSHNQSSDNEQKRQESTIPSSVWTKSSGRSPRSSLAPSKSDTKLHRNSKLDIQKKINNKSLTKTSLSNSTFGDRSMASSKTGASYLLTKSYKDDDKLNRYQKRKMYADSLRKSLKHRNQKAATPPLQVLEIRYLTVSKDDGVSEQLKNEVGNDDSPTNNLVEETVVEKPSSFSDELFDKDLPSPHMELVEPKKFREIFELPVDSVFNEILSENDNFLKKDFSYINLKGSWKYSSSEDVSTDDLLEIPNEKNDWYNFALTDNDSISEISCFRKKFNEINIENLDLSSQDHIVDSLSAPGSEESGYSTIKSRRMSRNFFKRPEIKALFDPPCEPSTESFCVEVQIEKSSSSSCGVQIKSIESKSLQTTATQSSQKSVQIKMSEEEMQKAAMEKSSTKSTDEAQISDYTEKSDRNIEEDCVDQKKEENRSENIEENLEEKQLCENSTPPCLSVITKFEEETTKIYSQCNLPESIIFKKAIKYKPTPERRIEKIKVKLSFLSCLSCVSSCK